MIIIYSTFSSQKEAKRLGELLVKNRMAACVNIFPIDSIYRWKNKIAKDKEWSVFIKTKKKNFRKIEQFILKKHSYTTPCIIAIPVQRVTSKYRKWLDENC